MLMEEMIRKNKYFQAIHMQNDDIVDSLTHTFKRPVIIAYIQYLMKKSVPFTMGILDLDNFKMINDTYGHQSGDEILAQVSKNIMEVAEDALAIGRYGGDEFLFVWTGITEYDTIWASLSRIFKLGVRKPIHLSIDKNIAMTATLGCNSFPKDAKTYDALFHNCDKCLYRGKQKGRNCYIIYVEYLHSKIDIQKTAKKNISERILELYEVFDTSEKKKKVYKAMRYLTDNISITGAAYFQKNKLKVSYEKAEEYGKPKEFDPRFLEPLEEKNYFIVNDFSTLGRDDPEFFEFCYENNLLSFIVFKVQMGEKNYGYVVFYDSDFKRIWQDDDIALFTVFVKTLANIAHFGNV